ncbi:MAG: resolvase protein, partial [uncultured bacterium]
MTNKYFIYCRKSSEQEDRQVLSLDSQECELLKVVKANNLSVAGIYKESGSAHVIGRKMFNDMLTRIENGEAQGLVVWDESRIARNSLDGGKVIYMMDLGQISEIYKPGKMYKNTPDDKSWLSMVFMMSKKESDDKGVNAKRGMTDKAKLGWMPSAAPLGYKNTPMLKKDYKEMVVDEEKFPLVKRLFTEIISGKQPCQVYKEASKIWKLTSQLGTIFSKSTFYNLLTKPFYYGEFEWPKGSGNWYKGAHKPMITRDEFDLIQKALGKMGRPIAHSHDFDLT